MDSQEPSQDPSNVIDLQAELRERHEEQLMEVLEHNRATIKGNQQSAMQWIAQNDGRGMVLACDKDGTFHTWIVGNADLITAYEPAVESNLYDMLMLLVGSHLPGSSLASQAYHKDQVDRLDTLDKKLDAVANNLGALVSFLQMKFPELQVRRVGLDGKPVNSGIITPG